MAGQAQGRGVLIFRKDEAGNGGVVGLVAAKAGEPWGVLAQGAVEARDRMSPDGMVEFMSFVEVEVQPGIHFLEWDFGTPRQSEGVRLTIHFHETADVASHADFLRRGAQMRGEITGVWRVAEVAVTLLVGGMLHRVRGQLVTGEAELIRGSGESDVSSTLDGRDRVANCAAHRDSGVDIRPRSLVLVARETFGGIHVCGENHGMLVKVGTRRRSRKYQEESSQEYGEKNGAVGRVRERHSSPFAGSAESCMYGDAVNAAARISPDFPAGNASW